MLSYVFMFIGFYVVDILFLTLVLFMIALRFSPYPLFLFKFLQLIFLFFQADQRQQLLLTSLLGCGRKATVKKSVHASLARQRIVQEERERVVQAYRDIKKRKQQQQQQQLNKSFLVVDKLKKPAWVNRTILSFRKTQCHYKPVVERQPGLLSFFLSTLNESNQQHR